jgi:hypothetical protein
LCCVGRIDGFVVGSFDAARFEPGDVQVTSVVPFFAADLAVEVFALDVVERVFEVVGGGLGDAVHLTGWPLRQPFAVAPLLLLQQDCAEIA